MLRHRPANMMASSVPAPQDPDPYRDRRAYARVTVALPAFLQANGERHPVQLVDLSAGGAKLICAARPSIGTAVILDCGTLRRASVVRWQNGEFLGLCFDSELDVREISALIDRSRALAALKKTRE
ncbi:MAG: PilZ domain-containing protein [Sphingomicrobium sp.]